MATQVAARTASATAKVLPPSSPFSELLRRSRFASYDPEIRQAYGAPPSYIHRGNWGLKRPIANKKRNSFIVLKNFEEHAQYIEWDSAEEQVRFLKRVEELNVAPKLVDQTNWYASLGPLATTYASGLDSEFCPGEDGSFGRAKRAAIVEQDSVKAEQELEVDLVDDLEKTQGKGKYGAKAPPPRARRGEDKGQTFLQPNIMAMPPRIFKQYLEKLREMRPEFLDFLRKEMLLSKRKAEVNPNVQNVLDPEPITDEELVTRFAEKLYIFSTNYHMRFLGFKNEASYTSSGEEEASDAEVPPNAPQPIRPQPHRLGGLMYALPTPTETYYSTKPQPGHVLQSTTSDSRINRPTSDYMASFAGLSAYITESGPTLPPPVFNLDAGIDPATAPASESPMRVLQMRLENLPDVVGKHATSIPARKVQILTDVGIPHGPSQDNWRENPHKPGSFEYNMQLPLGARSSVSIPLPTQAAEGRPPLAGIPSNFATSPWFGHSIGKKIYDKNASATKLATGSFARPQSHGQYPELNGSTLDLLATMARGSGAAPRKKGINLAYPILSAVREAESADKNESEGEGESAGEGERVDEKSS